MNFFFTNFGPDLAWKIAEVKGSYLDYLKSNNNNMYVLPTTADEIISITGDLNLKKCTARWHFTKVVKFIIQSISLQDICNWSLITECFP